MTDVWLSKFTIIDSDNGLSPGRHQTIIWTNAGILLIGPVGTNFSEILITVCIFLLKKNAFENVIWKMAAILSQPQCVNPLNAVFVMSPKFTLKKYHCQLNIPTWYRNCLTVGCELIYMLINIKSDSYYAYGKTRDLPIWLFYSETLPKDAHYIE